MRTIRALKIAGAILVALPAFAAAQQGRQFRDAWFWGVKAGGFTFAADSSTNFKTAPLAGVEMLITRHHGGLYISGGQAFINAQALTFRDPLSADSGLRVINLKNMRQLDVALMGFPGDYVRWHPYLGIGFTMSAIADADPQGPFSSVDQLAFADSVIQQNKVGFSPLFIGGAQYRLLRFSVFGQLTASPAQKNFLLYNGRPWNFSYEFGLRYNVGTSIDRGS
jgi:hypothetical protein